MAAKTAPTAPPASKLGNCRCGTLPGGREGGCTAQTKKSFAQGHDARMSSRIATAIAKGELTESAGTAAIRAAGGGEQLISKTLWSAALRAKKGEPKPAKTCRSCSERPVAKKGDAKRVGLCDECNEQALDDNAEADGHDDLTNTQAERAALLEEDALADAEAADLAEAESVEIKIGRWTYQATIDDKGDAHYTNKRDEPMTAVAGGFTLVK